MLYRHDILICGGGMIGIYGFAAGVPVALIVGVLIVMLGYWIAYRGGRNA